MGAPSQVQDLLERYRRNRRSYEDSHYNETQVRREFLDPLFIALGWDVNNESGYAEPYKDVVHEYRLEMTGGAKTPDYSFRVGGTRKFFVEAKRPGVNLRDDPMPAFQLRRYAWSAKLPLSILSNFREFVVYDCRQEPSRSDTAATARTVYIQYEELDEKWDEIADVFSKTAVLTGSFDAYAIENIGRRGSLEVDDAFLREMQEWRKALATHIALKNELTQAELNFAVQQTLDRIVFLRICEDRGIEEHGKLKELLTETNVYVGLSRLFQQADARYNSGLFHFRSERGREDPDTLTLGLSIGNRPLKDIIGRLYYPDSPYAFDVLPPSILGQVYEQFLGQVIVLTGTHKARIEDKPEVKKAGGVYYTPTHVVDHIVRRTLTPLLEGKTPQQLARANGAIRVLDPACGSGTFLLSAYEFLLDWYLDWYCANDPEKWARARTPRIRPGQAEGEWRLTTTERKRILLSHVFGVDIDAQAVEVTRLSLMLKVLEGESNETLNQQMLLFHERALPDLTENIRCGNSLVEPRPYANQTELPASEPSYVNAFDWSAEFHDAMQAGGFDAVIGNPPWLMAGYYIKDSLDYFHDQYATAQGKYDLYYLFLEKGCSLLSRKGRLGMIVPNKFFHTEAAESLRELLVDGKWVQEVVDFHAEQVFRRATNYSCLLFLKRSSSEPVAYTRALPNLDEVRNFSVPRSTLRGTPWYFHDKTTRGLFERVRALGTPLGDLTERFGTGVQSGADSILLLTPERASELELEQEVLRPMLRGRDVREFRVGSDAKLLLFPYIDDESSFRIFTPAELARYGKVHGYLLANRGRLEGRSWFSQTAQELTGEWYGMMYLEPRSTFLSPHILTPSLSRVANFALGSGDLFATGTAGVTAVVPTSGLSEDISYLVGLLNSTVMTAFAISHSPVFRGAYYKFSAPYLKDLPIRRIDFSNRDEAAAHDRIVSLAAHCGSLYKQLERENVPHERTAIRRALTAARADLDATVNQLYAVSPSEARTVETIVNLDAKPDDAKDVELSA